MHLAAVKMEEREVEFEGAERGFDPPAGMIYICNRSSRVGIGRKIGSDKLKAVRVGDSEADKTERDLQKRMITVEQINAVALVNIKVWIVAKGFLL